MRKNFLLFICVLLCAALLAAVLTACNDEDGTQTVKPGGEGQTGEELPDGGLVFELASDGESYAVADYTGTSTEVEIPSVHEGLPVTSIGQYAFRECSGLTSVIIPDSVTRIGDSAFSGCSSLESITLPFVGAEAGKTSSDTYQYPFGYIFGTSSYTGGTAVKQYYYGRDPSSTTSTTYYIPSSLRSVTVTGGNILRGAFGYCSMLTSITIPDNVTSIGDSAFYGCSGLTSITIPNGVTSIGDSAFYCCYGLTSVTIPNGVTSIGDSAFYCCYGLTSVTIPNGVASIGNSAFSGCRGLTTVTIPDRVTGIGDSAFYCCNGLTSVTIGDSVTSIGIYAFLGCAKLVEVYNKSTLDIKSGSIDYGYVAYYAKNVYTQEGGSWFTDTSDGFRFFYDGEQGYLMGYLGTETEIELPASFTAYNGTFVENYEIYEDTFAYCSDLTSIIIPDSVTSIGRTAFRHCTELTSITIPDSVTSIGVGAFTDCSSLTSVVIGDSVTSIGMGAFEDCSSLTSIVVDDGNYVYHSAGNCIIETASKTLIVGCKNSIIPDDGSVTSIGGFAFWNCDGLTTVTIPDSVTSIGINAFSGCSTNLLEKENGVSYVDSWVIDFDESVSSVELREGTRGIADSAFENCTNLTTVTIPDSVTSIGIYAFRYCDGLTSVTIPDSVTSIGFGAFSDCSGLKYVTFEGTVAEWNVIEKGISWSLSCPFTYVECSDGTVSV